VQRRFGPAARFAAIGQIFEAVRAAIKIPFTVKFRAGWNDEKLSA
jgi:tRNA-dihydrouridine synthase